MKTTTAVVATLCGLVLGAGCGKRVQERMIEKAIERDTGTKADVRIGKEGFTAKTDKGQMSVTSGQSARVPENFPADVLVYKGANVVMAMQVGQANSVSLTTPDDMAKVVETYKQEMTARGWSQEAALDMGEQTVLTYRKEGRTTAVAIAKDEGHGGTQINLTVTQADS